MVATTIARIEPDGAGPMASHGRHQVTEQGDVLADILLAAAVELAEHHWRVIPLHGKVPAIPSAHPAYKNTGCCTPLPPADPLRGRCKGGCGKLGHGLYDATDDVATVRTLWSGPYRGCNIGALVPESMLLIDIDPRHGGDTSWAGLLRHYGPFPECLRTISGRGDGGVHLYVRRPPGRLTVENLGSGIELKTSRSFGVQAPSIHPITGKPYVRIDGPVPAPPEWFIELVVDRRPSRSRSKRHGHYSSADSPADAFCAVTSWEEILGPHGWECLDLDPEEDGSRWLHPAATSSCSATIRHCCLFVYSTNTPFAVTEPGSPRGYTKFRAYAVLNHQGDLRAAARALGKGVGL
jgi:Bifunctional DNA primase/polymerase, N-terminal